MLYIILIVIGILVYLIYKSIKINPKKVKLSVEEILQKARENKEKILGRCKKQNYNLYQDEIDMLEAMEEDVIRLNERHKHNSETAIQISNDYLDYTNALSKIIKAGIFDDAKSFVGYGDSLDNLEDYHAETKNPHIIVQEIGKRIIEMVGDDSKYKKILNKMSSCVMPADTGKVKIGDRYR